MDNEKCRKLLQRSWANGSRMANKLYELRMKSCDRELILELVAEWDKLREDIEEAVMEKALDNS